MTKQNKLIDHFAKVNDNYTITNCDNGFMVEVSGHDSADNWITRKLVLKKIEEIQNIVKVLSRIPRT